MIAGGRLGNGTVQTYHYDGQAWTLLQEIVGDQVGSLFGSSVALRPPSSASPGFIVGAPGTQAAGSSLLVGAAAYYELDSATQSSWTRIGSLIRGDESIYSNREAFGFSVATSANRIVACGAPFSDDLNVNQRGKVYTFLWNVQVNDWTPVSVFGVVGDSSNALLGSAVDIATDGSVLVAGGPGRNNGDGYAVVLVLNSSLRRWQQVAVFEAASSSLEGFGASVVMVDDLGDIIAVGGPGYQSGRGVIRVYQRQASDGSYAQVGADIVGESSSDALGSAGTLSGSVVYNSNAARPTIVITAATTTGLVRRYEWQSSTSVSWDQPTAAFDTSLVTVRALSLSADGSSFVAGGRNQVEVFVLG
jgi:hypothetical protein